MINYKPFYTNYMVATTTANAGAIDHVEMDMVPRLKAQNATSLARMRYVSQKVHLALLN